MFAGFLRSGVIAALMVVGGVAYADSTITFIHTNDLHAHVEATKIKDVALGGYARHATLIRKLKQESVNPLLLNGGDVFQGTLYFNTYNGLADLAYMHYVGYDAMAVGNHEFDKGPSVLADFARSAKFPLLSANIDVSNEPLLKDEILPSTILEVGSEKIGLVGATTVDLPIISNIGLHVRMKEIVPALQAEIDKLTAQGINKIAVVSHCGFSEERALVRELSGVDIVVGGHSHTLLGKLEMPEGVSSRGSYPTVEKNKDGKTALVVQAWEWGKVIGRIAVTFDDNGDVKSWDGSPIKVDESIPEDPTMATMVEAFRMPLLTLKTQKVGEAKEDIDRAAYGRESAVGNLIADSMLEATKKAGAQAAFMNAGGIRAPIPAGNLTFGGLIEVQPFNNTLVVMDLTGAEIKKVIEFGVRNAPDFSGGFIHVSSGTSYVVTPRQPADSKVSDIMIAGAPLDPAKTYKITVNSFMSTGGDGHETLKNAPGARIDTGLLDIDALVDYVKANSPISPLVEGRITAK